jgi:hypothetical protein
MIDLVDYKILTHTSRLLVVETPTSYQYLAMIYLFLVPVLAGGGLFLYFRGINSPSVSQRLRLFICLGVPVLCLLPGLVLADVTHRMTLSRDTDSGVFVTRLAGLTLHTRTVKLSDIHSCVVAYDRGVPVLRLVLTNGLTMRPLAFGSDPTVGIEQVQSIISKFLVPESEKSQESP